MTSAPPPTPTNTSDEGGESIEPSVSSIDRSALEPGVLVPELVRTIGLLDMVAYAGATWDWHRCTTIVTSVVEWPTRPSHRWTRIGALLVESLSNGLDHESL